jgi:Integrase core domain/Mu transposase, C-terminal
MATKIFVNDLIQWVDSLGESRIDRILWIDTNYCIAYSIDINGRNSLPEAKNISEIEESIELGQAIKYEQDPWGKIVVEEELPDSHKNIRDTAWQIISDVVIKEPDIYERRGRGKLIAEILLISKLTKKIIYKHLRRYWQRGKTKSALLPDYQNCGAEGKVRKSGDKKRGRPRKYAHDPDIGVGINITEELKRVFRISIKRFYHKSTKRSLVATYLKMIQEYFAEKSIQSADRIHGSLILKEQRPTISQFRYWYQQEFGRDVRTKIISRSSRKDYEANHRSILGNSTMEADRPGARFQIDATVADVYLISRDRRNEIIGRPIVYAVLDVFSRMVVGIYVGLEGPSWLGAMMALDNTMSNKVQFCAEYGVSITEEQWPCQHLPEAIIGDRGEILSSKIDPLVANLNIRVENTATFRPDMKGIVERSFRTIQEKVKPFIPGAIAIDFRERGADDYRLDATLDLSEFTEIIIEHIIEHNNTHYLEQYPIDSEMIQADVMLTPIEIWNWGIINRSGKLKTMERDIVRLNLMPRDRALITGKGIRFKGMLYTCDRAEEERWFDRAYAKSLSKEDKYLNIAYDPRTVNYIYIPNSDSRSFIKCHLLPSQIKYLGQGIDEVEFLSAYYKYKSQKHQKTEDTAQVNLAQKIEAIVDKAKSKTNAVKDPNLSDRKRTQKIRDHRSEEKNERREVESFELDKLESKLLIIEDIQNIQIESESTKEQPIQKSHKAHAFDALQKNRQRPKRGQT